MQTATRTKTQKKKSNIYQEITRKIVFSLSQNDIPWRKPWVTPTSRDIINYVSRKPYRGINRLLLGRPGEYLTFRQCEKAGGRVRPGAKGTLRLIYHEYIPAESKEEYERLTAEGKPTGHLLRLVAHKGYVWHIDDTEGIETKFQATAHRPASSPTDIADFVIRQWSGLNTVSITEMDTDNCSWDRERMGIAVPRKSQFEYEEEWYSAVFHMMMKASSDLENNNTGGSENIEAKRELTEEIGASMMLNAVGLSHREAEKNTQAKCREWADMLNRDYRLIVNACSAAEKKAAEILSPLLGKPEDMDEDDEI